MFPRSYGQCRTLLAGLAVGAALLTGPAGTSATMPAAMDYSQLDQTHDLRLPAWGPYSKRYAGISHLPDLPSGLRFDVSVLPGYYRSRVVVPNVLFESGYHPWALNADFRRLTYRYELEWKDRVFVDVTYSTIASNQVLVAMRCVNRSGLPQNLDLNLVASLAYPDVSPAVQALPKPGTTWVNAVDYRELSFAHPRPSDKLVYDGWLRGEARDADYIGGSAVAKGFGKDRGDRVSYRVALGSLKQGALGVRYRLANKQRAVFHLKGLTDQAITFNGTGQFELLTVPFTTQGDDAELTLESEGGSEVELNGFFVGADKGGMVVAPVEKRFTPDIRRGNKDRSVVLKYPDVKDSYGIAWDFSPSVVREYVNDELDIFFRKYTQDHVQKKFAGNGQGHFTDVFLRPIELAPNTERTAYALLCVGAASEVDAQLAQFTANPQAFVLKDVPADDSFGHILPEGEPYVFSQGLMRACTLANVVYPIYTQRGYIRHFTPGKWWNSLYTWDSGFIALGLAEIDSTLSVQCLNAYTTPANSQSAFIHHGSPVPVQAYAFLELWNRTQSPELRAYFYPRLKRYYEFLSGKTAGSTTRVQASNLLATWDYFYNSGGWDDYPAQKAVHDQKLEKSVTPVITTAQCIRFAKILRLMAVELAQDADVRAYDADIKTFTAALQQHAWDEAGGYFGYVTHDKQGHATGFFKDKASGQNFNQGLDGAYPLVAGICTPAQQDTLVQKIFSPTNMWTPAGISVVDQSAPYYRGDGYWNGSVWMPHQWFVWKAMLDLGKPDRAWQVAHKALDVWKTETDASYFTFEHFLAQNGRGAGWHQFSALSTPVIAWFNAYYRPGTVTTGFEVLIRKQSFAPDFSRYDAELAFDRATAPHARSVLVCLSPDSDYQVTFSGQKIEAAMLHRGLLQLTLPATNEAGQLSIRPLGK